MLAHYWQQLGHTYDPGDTDQLGADDENLSGGVDDVGTDVVEFVDIDDPGDLCHESLDEAEPEPPPPATPVVTRVVYSRDDAQRAWARRRADLKDIAGLETVLNEVDARAK